MVHAPDDFTRLLWYVDEINIIYDAATTDSGITNSVHCMWVLIVTIDMTSIIKWMCRLKGVDSVSMHP